MALLTKTPDAELDVIDGGFGTIPALGLQGFRYGVGLIESGNSRPLPIGF
jgi:hypothetical protein